MPHGVELNSHHGGLVRCDSYQYSGLLAPSDQFDAQRHYESVQPSYHYFPANPRVDSETENVPRSHKNNDWYLPTPPAEEDAYFYHQQQALFDQQQAQAQWSPSVPQFLASPGSSHSSLSFEPEYAAASYAPQYAPPQFVSPPQSDFDPRQTFEDSQFEAPLYHQDFGFEDASTSSGSPRFDSAAWEARPIERFGY